MANDKNYKNMKKLIITAIIIASATIAYAQPRAIGVRVGYDNGITYQHSLSESKMMNMELGYISFNGVQLSAPHDWIFPIESWKKKGTWNWYAGVGAGVSFMDIKDLGLFVGIAGRIGVEYNFAISLQLSLDWRPMFGPTFYFNKDNLIGYSGADIAGFAVSVRYNFNK